MVVADVSGALPCLLPLLGTPLGTPALLSRMLAFHVECGPGCLAASFNLDILPRPSSELLPSLRVSVSEGDALIYL